MKNRDLIRTISYFICSVILYGCSDNSNDTHQKKLEQPVVKVNKSDESIESIKRPTIVLEKLPALLDFDPCQLLTTSELNEIGLPDDQYVAQQGFSKQLPNHSLMSPVVGCKWRNVDKGTPVGWIEIQQIKGDFKPRADEQYGVGDISWKRTNRGRDQLMVKVGSRLVMVTSQIPYNNKSEMESNLWIAKKVLSRLNQVTNSTTIKLANANLVAGPAIDVCAASRKESPYELLQGDIAWGFPNIDINHVPSKKKRPQEDGVSCVYSSNRRGTVNVSYLGRDGVKRWGQHFDKNGSKVSFNGHPAFRDKRTLYVPLKNGAIMISVYGIKYFSDDEVDQKVEKIATALLKEFEQ